MGYTLGLSHLFQAQVFFVFGDEAYAQGLMRKIDDKVLVSTSAEFSKPVTRRPEIRLAYLMSSEYFTQRVVQMLEGKYAHSITKYSSAISQYSDSPDKALFLYVRQNLHYYRHELDEFHKLRWHFFEEKLAEQQLHDILELFESVLREELTAELDLRLSRATTFSLRNAAKTDLSFVSDFITILKARKQTLSSKLPLLFKSSDITTTAKEVYPNKSAVAVIVYFAWITIGLTALSFYLPHRRSRSLL
ncbi:hypothetical protein CWE21_10845 [Pseudidiomarina aquimaris]|uniref:Uncharacterized protein n=1 Tax=Pseudidiomarina aquimaris TaxID=641841 RepID=A0A432XD09_9GAMM|nr:hypothetical protein CWE21_10845 [Pseudidiomarina aquimaris]